MLLRYFYDSALAQASYMLGCQAAGEALVVDPARNITPYLETAAREGLRITQVTETHIHADFVSGARELAAATGAHCFLSGMGGPDWQYADAAATGCTLLVDGAQWWLGRVRLEALHTPGHTPEHLCILFTDTRAADQPMGIFTGDCLFAGDIGRPDLLETAAGVAGSKEIGARDQFHSIQRLKGFADYLLVLPGHGAGSACGKALGAVPSSTLGYEKLFNPAFQFSDEAPFCAWLLSGQPETPRYFARMKRVNREGPALLRDLPAPVPLEGFILEDAVRQGVVIDARSADQYNESHVPGAINIPATDRFSTYAGWIVDYARPTYLIAMEDALPELTRQLRSIGVDDLPGCFPPEEVEGTLDSLPVVSVAEAAGLVAGGAPVIDVRGRSEYLDGHIAGARLIHYGLLERTLDTIPREGPLLLHCASGFRSQIAASILQKHGYANAVHLRGGFQAWQAAGLPVVMGE